MKKLTAKELTALYIVLKANITIQLDNDCKLIPDIENMYLEPMYCNQSLGLWLLTKEGLKNAIQDLKNNIPSDIE